jgi:tape measure domain-containing protein
MLNEEIARLTGKLVFQVDNRPLATFEKKLGGVLTMLRELSTLANKKFTVKVSLDSKSLRGQIERATKTKISLTNVDISQEALVHQGRRIQEYLNKTTINLNNVKVDIGKLVEQKRFIKTLLGQMQLTLPVKLGLNQLERELKTELAAVGKRQRIQVEGHLNVTQFIIKLRRALKQAQNNMGPLKLRIADPQVRLKVDKQHLVDEIRAAIASSEFKIRVGATRDRNSHVGGSSGTTGHGRSQTHRGLSAMEGFARGALPGLGAAFALDRMNNINQRVVAASNSLEAVSGNEEKFNSNKNFVNNLAKEQGLNFRDVAPQFSSIYQSAAPSIGVKGTQDMFRGIMKYGTVHGLDKEAMKGSMVALSQMFGKDKIQSEEARQQFSERMPNGMALLAEAAKNAGMTKKGTVAEFGDLMKKGNADPKKILPELGKLMEALADKNNAYAKSLETTRVAQGRMNNAFEDSVVLFAKGGFDKGMGSFFRTISENLERAAPLVEALGKAFEILILPVNAMIRIVGAIGENWGKFSDALGVSKEALATFAAGLALFMLPFGGFLVTIGLVALALDDLITYFSGGESVFGQMVADAPGAQDEIDKISQAWEGLKQAIDDVGEAAQPVLDKLNLKDVKMNDIFLTALTKVREQLEMIESLVQRIAALMRGDFKEAFSNLPGPKEVMIDKNPLFAPARWWGPKITGAMSDAAGAIGDWATGGSSMPTDQPTTYTGTVDRSGGAVTTGPISLTIQVTAPEGKDAQTFATELSPHFETLMDGALKKMLGSARSQQAERQ